MYFQTNSCCPLAKYNKSATGETKFLLERLSHSVLDLRSVEREGRVCDGGRVHGLVQPVPEVTEEPEQLGELALQRLLHQVGLCIESTVSKL